jgi:hypothetical protein
LSDKKVTDPNDPDFNPLDPENMRGDTQIGLDDRTALVQEARVEQGNFGAQLILVLLPDGEEKAWTKYYNAGEKAKVNDTGTGFVDEGGLPYAPTKNSEVGQFGIGLSDSKIKNFGAIGRDLTKLAGHRLHFKEVVQRYAKDGDTYKKGDAKKRKFTYRTGPKAGQSGVAEKTVAIPVSVVSYPGGVAAGASDAVEAKAREVIIKAIQGAPGGKLAVAELSRSSAKLINGDPDKAAILAKVADKGFLKNSEGFVFDGLTLSI